MAQVVGDDWACCSCLLLVRLEYLLMQRSGLPTVFHHIWCLIGFSFRRLLDSKFDLWTFITIMLEFLLIL